MNEAFVMVQNKLAKTIEEFSTFIEALESGKEQISEIGSSRDITAERTKLLKEILPTIKHALESGDIHRGIKR